MYFTYLIILSCLWGCVWGVVTKKVMENKGYYENWFWWGFFFGIFALIVALTKPNYSSVAKDTVYVGRKMTSQGGWLCKCGRTNPSYTGTCVCGATKDSLAGKEVVASGSPLTALAAQAESEKMRQEEKQVLSNGGWKCHRCGGLNPEFIGFCGCGMSRGENKEIDKRMEKEVAAPKPQQDKFQEVKKYKELLDEGVISREEFEEKKKQLLGF